MSPSDTSSPSDPTMSSQAPMVAAVEDWDVLVLMPVFNDWDACWKLLERLDDALSQRGLSAEVLLIDDGSELPPEPPADGGHLALRRISLLELRGNVGHQRAICLGLCHVEAEIPCDVIVVMDADGEDSPDDVPRLLERLYDEGGGKVVFAERRKRSESLWFRVCYFLYRWLHLLLTGERVRVGNFSAVPRAALGRLVVVPALWSHYAAAVFTSRQPYCSIQTQRAARLDGRSKMNFVSLVTHGLTAISVFSERVGVRLLLACLAMASLLTAGIGAVVAIRLLTPWAIPGWATFTTGLLAVILIQCLSFAMLFCFMILAGRNRQDFLPIRDFGHFVGARRALLLHHGDRGELLAGRAHD